MLAGEKGSLFAIYFSGAPLITPNPQNPSLSTSQPLKSGHVPASGPLKFPNKSQNEPRFSSNHPLFAYYRHLWHHPPAS